RRFRKFGLVLAGSAAYAVGEALRWPTGLAPVAKRSQSLLCHDRCCEPGWSADELQPDRSDPRALLERCSQWRRRGSDHGGHDDRAVWLALSRELTLAA